MAMSKLPVISDVGALLERLTAQERASTQKLAELEDRLRRFEDVERPRYESWLRVEFGREFSVLEEIFARIRERRILIRRIQELVETFALQPREALYVASAPQEETTPQGAEEFEENGKTENPRHDPNDRESVEARRRAKLEAKRAAKKAEKKAQKKSEKARPEESPSGAPERVVKNPGTSRLVSLYRALARQLHPDSAVKVTDTISEDQRHRLWLEIQSAYDSSDEERLLAVAAWLGSTGEAVPLTLAERHERLRALARSSRKLEKRLESLAEHPAWGFLSAGESANRKLRKTAAREVEDELGRAQEAIDALDDFVESIGSPRKPKKPLKL